LNNIPHKFNITRLGYAAPIISLNKLLLFLPHTYYIAADVMEVMLSTISNPISYHFLVQSHHHLLQRSTSSPKSSSTEASRMGATAVTAAGFGGIGMSGINGIKAAATAAGFGIWNSWDQRYWMLLQGLVALEQSGSMVSRL